MSDIQKISRIKRDTLSEEFYTASLIEQAYAMGQMSENDVQKVQLECLALLAQKIEEHNGGKSSSVRVEIAEDILQSIMFTIGIVLKKVDTPDEAVNLLCKEKISLLYVKGRKLIDTKIKVSKQLYRMSLRNLTLTQNYMYNSTIVDGIRVFFKHYNPDYSANQIYIATDYPTAITIKGFVGIEFMMKYIECIYYENIFCSMFSEQNIHRLLCGYMNRYSELVINIFTFVLINAIGCEMLHKDPFQLNITKEERECLNHSFSGISKEELTVDLLITCRLLCETMEITSTSLKTYIESTVPNIASNIFFAVENGTLSKVFLEFPQI